MSKVFIVAKILDDDMKLVLNAGTNEKIKEGYRFLIYSLGEDVLDPDTKQSLGPLEIIKGTGVVVHVQEQICTIESDMEIKGKTIQTKVKPPEWKQSIFMYGEGERTEIRQEDPMEKPFDNPEVGDFAKYIP